MTKKQDPFSHHSLSDNGLQPHIIGPTLPPIPPFTFPIGVTGPKGDPGPTGPT
ncbi:exosporium leader peptide-containing protein, partial [Bacillus wiedmannii]|uniref:exosporium leader peptide-containing protein n=1 Tax=Bacillus wiedmannii TaxID=1890302 RepID=UPI000BEC8C37